MLGRTDQATQVTVHDNLARLPVALQALFDSKGRSVFLSMPWFRCLTSTVLGQENVRVYAVEDHSGHIQAVLPMWQPPAASGLFAIRRLQAAANFYTPIFRPLVSTTGEPTRLLSELATHIATGRDRCDMVLLYPLDRTDPVFDSTVAAFRSAGMLVQPYFCFGNWYLKVRGRSYAQYAARLPSRLRNTLERKRRRLEAHHRLHWEILSSERDIEKGIATYEAVYAASWKPSEGYREFMPALLRACAQQRWLRLGIAYIDNIPAAAQVWIVADGVASIYKLAYDPRFAEHSIGSLLTETMMQYVIDIDRVAEVDFLSGDDAYKQDWMSDRRERWGIAAYNLHTVKGMLLASLHVAKAAIKSLPCIKNRLTARAMSWRNAKPLR